jgi:3alpha(or 20beta)-hydroxysteroid dehydrogenase
MSDDATKGRLAGRVALVTGGAGGIGKAIVTLFEAQGASVLIADVDADPGIELADATGASCEFVQLDVTQPAQWRSAIERSVDLFGKTPSVLVQAAGIMIEGLVEHARVDDVRSMMEINVIGTLYGMQAVLPGMKAASAGSIVLIASAGGVVFGVANHGGYGASKAAGAALAKSAAIEFGSYGVRVNSIIPGGVDTPMNRRGSVVDRTEFYRAMPISRIGEPDDIAYAALYLASEESSWVTGTNLLVDGGMSAGPPVVR